MNMITMNPGLQERYYLAPYRLRANIWFGSDRRKPVSVNMDIGHYPGTDNR